MKILRVDLQKATQESSEEICRRFHIVNSSETFQHLYGFQETR